MEFLLQVGAVINNVCRKNSYKNLYHPLEMREEEGVHWVICCSARNGIKELEILGVTGEVKICS